MRNKQIIAAWFAILFTGVLVLFYWLEFFPSRYKIKLGLMLGAWLIQIIGMSYYLWQVGRTRHWFGKTGLVMLTVIWGLIGLVYCWGSSDDGIDREFVETIEANNKRVELYHLDRYDHIAIEVFYGTSNDLLAHRYYKDHFTIDKVSVIGTNLSIQNYLRSEKINLELNTLKLTFSSAKFELP